MAPGGIVMKPLSFSALCFVLSTVSALAQDVTAGETSFRKCAPCHSIGLDAKNKVGPELNWLDGRRAGAVPGFNYSDANKGSWITWNEMIFKQYISDPRAMVPVTKMVFAGNKNAKERDDLWAYVDEFDTDGNIKKKWWWRYRQIAGEIDRPLKAVLSLT
jgi:cytochrome c